MSGNEKAKGTITNEVNQSHVETQEQKQKQVKKQRGNPRAAADGPSPVMPAPEQVVEQLRALRQQISAALHLVIQAQRLMGGRRKIVSVCEITGMEGDQIQMHELFVFEQTGVDENGHATGRFVATGIRPRIITRIEHAGLKLPAEWFARRVIQ